MSTDQLNAVLGDSVPVACLVHIYENDGDTYGQEISRRTGYTYGSINSTVRNLINHGYVEGDKNGRKLKLSLTDKGVRVAEPLADAYHNLP